MSRRDARALRDEVANAIDRGKFKRAIECILELEQLEPRDAAWPKRAAEVYRRLGKSREAIGAYERSVDRYVQAGFLVQAIAVCKQILQLDPQHSATLRRLAEIAEERQTGPTGVAAISSGVPELLIQRQTGPIPKVDPRTLVPDDRSIDMLEMTGGRGRSVSMMIDAQLAPDGEISLDATDPVPLLDLDPDPEPARLPPPPPPPPRTTTTTGRPRRISPPPVPGRRRRASTNPVSLEPGAPLDTIPLRSVMPDAEIERRDDGLQSGIIVIPLDDVDDVTGPIAIETLPPSVGDDTIEVPLEAVEEAGAEPEELTIDSLRPLSSGDEELPEPRSLGAAARRALRATPLLSGLDADQLEALIEHIELAQLEPGEVLFREGDTGDTLYIISEGEVGVFSEGPPRRELSRLLPGAFFGEVALITEQPRSATIQAVARTELLAIDRDVVRNLIAEHPDALRVILRFIRNRLVERVIQTSPLFVPFPESERRSLAERFDFLEVEPDTKLLTQGARPEGLFVILAGKAEALRDLDGAARRLGFLGPGEVFGEDALLSAEPSLVSVVARGKVLALRMPGATFREVIMTHPQVLAYVGDLADARRRQLEAAPEDSGDVVDLKLDLL